MGEAGFKHIGMHYCLRRTQEALQQLTPPFVLPGILRRARWRDLGAVSQASATRLLKRASASSTGVISACAIVSAGKQRSVSFSTESVSTTR